MSNPKLIAAENLYRTIKSFEGIIRVADDLREAGSLEESIAKLKVDLTALQQKHADTKIEIAQLKAAAEKEITEWKQNASEHFATREKEIAALAETAKQEADAATAGAKVTADKIIADAQAPVTAATNALAIKTKELADLQAQIHAAKLKHTEALDAVTDAQKQLTDINGEIAAIRRKLTPDV